MKVRLIELFAGIGSQAMALKELRINFEHYRVVEFDKFAIKSYNAIHGTDFETTDIRNISSVDLGIYDTDKYCYIMTYSFPCQDLSVAGKQKGMAKGSGTRSGLLWEVERILNECHEFPQVLLMENVPQVHSKANMPDFQKWIDFLEYCGYSNYWQDLNAKDYGVAQNRNRCFMVSLLGERGYKFPQPIPLEWKLKDYLENEVDEKYYINTEKAQKLIQRLIENGTLKDGVLYPNDTDFEMDNESKTLVDLSLNNPRKKTISNCIAVKDRGGDIKPTISRKWSGGMEKEVLGSVYYKTSEEFQRGLYPIARTVKAEQHDLAVVEMQERRLGNIYGFDGGNYAGNVYDKEMLSPTIRTYQGGNQQPMIVAVSGRKPDDMVLENVCINDRGFSEKSPQISVGTVPTLKAETHGNLPKVIEGGAFCIGGLQEHQSVRVDGISPTLTAAMGMGGGYIPMTIYQYRIRKLTPLECWRLMGFSDEDFRKAEEVNSNSQLYKQAGNSIVKDVLVAIFWNLFLEVE